VSTHFEKIVIFSVMSVLVMLFTWIYMRDRQQRVGLWMLGWIAIFVHFAAELLADFSFLTTAWADFIEVATLEVAGICFVLSVSQAYGTTRRRLLYFLLVGVPSVVYLAIFLWSPQHEWVFPVLILGSIGSVLANSWRHYRAKSYSFYLFLALPGVVAAIVAIKSFKNPIIGLIFYLTVFFAVTGLLYWRYYQRATPGVITTSISFLAWASVFPLGYILRLHNIGPPMSSVVWDLPKYFVAVGMILTLFENETATAKSVARRYRALFEVNLASVYLTTPEGQLLDCNKAFLNMYGYSSKAEVLESPLTALYPNAAERDLFLQHLQREGHVVNYECQQRRKDGSLFWVLEGATLLTDESGQTVIEGTSIDITERKKAEMALRHSEERFATIFRHSPIGCAIVSLEGVFLNANQALEKMLGLPAEQIIGKTGVELGFWKAQSERDKFFQRLCAEGSIKNMEIEFTNAAGNKRFGLYFGTLVRIGEKDCIFGMQLDRTEQRELESKFLQAQKMEAVGRLAGGVAHDFNNMLGVIGGYAELLEARLAREEKLRSYCSKILETTQRAGSLTSQLLTFSRKEISRPVALNPNQAIRELAAILPRLIGEDIEITLRLGARGSIVIDKIHFEQIIFNIVVNSRDAMRDGGELTIVTENKARSKPSSSPPAATASDQYVVIRIRDTGIGMDESTRLRAFEPFFTTKDTRRGTGLGLSTVYGIVQQCGGEIDIQSQPGAGTEISIFLPASPITEPVAEKETSLEVLPGNGHILLVEDETELRRSNAEFLRSIGYSVSCAANGVEALQLLDRSGRIDMVISDVVMPKMSGREFVNQLLKVCPDTKVLFISGHADDVVLQTGISRSGTPFLQKPYTLKQLSAKVHEILEQEEDRAVIRDETLANGD
jgi:PAS domain S-box-containing protein